MRITVTHTQQIELSDDAVEQVFEQRLHALCGGDGMSLSCTGKVMCHEHWGHGSGLTTEVKDPSPTMIAALKFRDALRAAKAEEIARQQCAELT